MGCRSDAVCGRPHRACSAPRASSSLSWMLRTAGGMSRLAAVISLRDSACHHVTLTEQPAHVRRQGLVR